jgi:hypothetical protein
MTAFSDVDALKCLRLLTTCHTFHFRIVEDLTIRAHKRRGGDIVLPLLPVLAESGCHPKRLTLSGCEYDAQSILLQIPPTTICTTLVSLNISYGSACVRTTPSILHIHAYFERSFA